MLFLYVILEAIVGIVLAIVMAARTKKAEGIVFGKLDRIGVVTNVALLVIYLWLCPPFMFVGMICEPKHDGFLGLIGWIVALICCSTTLVCTLSLGASVALRKKGKSIPSFIVQFAGPLSLGLTTLLYLICEGNLFRTLN